MTKEAKFVRAGNLILSVGQIVAVEIQDVMGESLRIEVKTAGGSSFTVTGETADDLLAALDCDLGIEEHKKPRAKKKAE